MSELLFHPIYAWNLAWDLIEAGEAGRSTYVEKNLAEGIRAGWLNPVNRQRARDMLVFADRVLLTGIDADIPQILQRDGHIGWGYNLPSIDSPSKFTDFRVWHAEMRELAPMLLALNHAHDNITPQQLSRALDYWTALDAWERKVAPQFDPRTWEWIDLARNDSSIKQHLLTTASSREAALRLFSQDPKRYSKRFEKIEQRLSGDVHFLKSIRVHAVSLSG
ncbi:MAG: hypothetical protein WA633_14110 [Stellaceae bacterium]